MVIRRFHDHDMPLTVNVMVGFPTERLRDFVDTIRFLTRTRKWLYQVSNVTSTQVRSRKASSAGRWTRSVNWARTAIASAGM